MQYEINKPRKSFEGKQRVDRNNLDRRPEFFI